MTIDEAIRHCEEVAENYRYQRDYAADINDVGTASDCQNCADEHEQLASWLRELKEAKRLLKAAVEDVETLAKAFAEDEPCGSFTLCSECPLCIKEGCSCKEWRYKAEALKLIGGETDEHS
jgi:hypothetical protein